MKKPKTPKRGRPALGERKLIPLTMKIDRDLRRRLEVAAKEEYRSLSSLISAISAKWLERREQPQGFDLPDGAPDDITLRELGALLRQQKKAGK